MADYIDREKLLKCETPYIHENYTGISEKPYDYVPVFSVDQIERQPSVDAVEVVRCKDCKHTEGAFCRQFVKRVGEDGTTLHCVKDTDFCKWGEKE